MSTETLLTNCRTVIISQNPNSGATDQGEIVEQLRGRLDAIGFQTIVLTDIQEVKRQTVLGLKSNTLRAVVAAGGDGTVSLLANELPAETPIAILPLGTENLLAKYLKIKTDPGLVADLIETGNTVRLDAGRANGRLFLVMASCGFDADVVTRLHSARTGHIRHWSYAKPIVGAISQYRYPKLSVTVDGLRKQIVGKWAFIFNVPRYAMNLPIVEDADCQDGVLDLCVFRGGNFLRGMFYLLAVLTRQHRGWQETRFERFRKIRIESDETVPFQLDGDPGGHLPVEIEVQPAFLKVVVSQEWIDQNAK